jgi:CheY-like chemotaxis protein
MIRRAWKAWIGNPLMYQSAALPMNGREALESPAQKKKPEIILSDIRMPRIEGLALAYQTAFSGSLPNDYLSQRVQ